MGIQTRWGYTSLFSLMLVGLLSACAGENPNRGEMASEAEISELIAAHNAGESEAGDKLVCRAVKPIGSNIPERECRTVRQLAFERESARKLLERRTGASAAGNN